MNYVVRAFCKRAKMIIADMPGYGFAYANEEQRQDWKGLVSHPPVFLSMHRYVLLKLAVGRGASAHCCAGVKYL